MYGNEGNSQFCFPKSPDVSRDEVEGNISTRGKTKPTGFPRDLTLSVLLYFQTFTSTYFNSNKRITGANQNSRLGTYKKTNFILKTTEQMIYEDFFLILSASFSSTSCCFSSGITLKIVAFQLWASQFVLLCSFTKKKTGSVFPVFCHVTFHHALITCCNVSRAGYIA